MRCRLFRGVQLRRFYPSDPSDLLRPAGRQDLLHQRHPADLLGPSAHADLSNPSHQWNPSLSPLHLHRVDPLHPWRQSSQSGPSHPYSPLFLRDLLHPYILLSLAGRKGLSGLDDRLDQKYQWDLLHRQSQLAPSGQFRVGQ